MEVLHRLGLPHSVPHRPRLEGLEETATAEVAVEAEEVVAAEAVAPTVTTCSMAMTRVGKVAGGISMTRSTT